MRLFLHCSETSISPCCVFTRAKPFHNQIMEQRAGIHCQQFRSYKCFDVWVLCCQHNNGAAAGPAGVEAVLCATRHTPNTLYRSNALCQWTIHMSSSLQFCLLDGQNPKARADKPRRTSLRAARRRRRLPVCRSIASHWLSGWTAGQRLAAAPVAAPGPCRQAGPEVSLLDEVRLGF